MNDVDLPRRPASTRRRASRLASPAGLILAGFCLLLPFLTASCASEERPLTQWRVTYTGIDVLTGGRPEIALTEDADRTPIHTLDDAEVRDLLGEAPPPLPPQPLGWLAVALMAAALAATALRSRVWRTTATAGLAIAAAIVLGGAIILARNDATDAVAAVFGQMTVPSSAHPVPRPRDSEAFREVKSTFHYVYGFWIALALLSVVGVANTVVAGRDPARRGD